MVILFPSYWLPLLEHTFAIICLSVQPNCGEPWTEVIFADDKEGKIQVECPATPASKTSNIPQADTGMCRNLQPIGLVFRSFMVSLTKLHGPLQGPNHTASLAGIILRKYSHVVLAYLCVPVKSVSSHSKSLHALSSCRCCLQLMVAPLQKLTPKANATIKDIGSIDSLVQSFGPYITGIIFLNTLHIHLSCQWPCFHPLIAATSKCDDQWCTMLCVMQCSACVGYCGELVAKIKWTQTWFQAAYYPTGTNLEDEDVVAKDVLDVDGRTYYQYESYAPYGTNGSHQVTRATTKVRHCLLTCS